jgi:hypothetical protein
MSAAPAWRFVPGRERSLPLRDARALALSPCERTLYAATDAALVALAVQPDASGAAPSHAAGHGAAWRHVVAARDGRRVYAATATAVRSFAAHTLTDERTVHGAAADAGEVVALALSPDGARLFVALARRGVLELSLASGTSLTPEAAAPLRLLPVVAAGGRVRAAALCPRGKSLACVQEAGVHEWELADGAQPRCAATLGTRADRVRALAWGPDGAALFAARSSSVREWARDARTTGGWAPRRRSAAGGDIAALAAAGAHVAVAGAGVLLVWHLGVSDGAPTSTNLITAERRGDIACAAAMSAYGRRLFAAFRDAACIDAMLLRPPRWSRGAHGAYPPGFRAGVRTLLLCLARTTAVLDLRWQPLARSAFVEAAAAQLAAQLYGSFHGEGGA